MKISKEQLKEHIRTIIQETAMNEGWWDAVKGGAKYMGQSIKQAGQNIKQAGVNASNAAESEKAYNNYKQLWMQANKAYQFYKQNFVKKGIIAKSDTKNQAGNVQHAMQNQNTTQPAYSYD